MDGRDRPTRRRGVALADAMIGGLMLAIGLSVVLTVAGRSMKMQMDGERQMTASWLADELLNMVVVEGPDNYRYVHDTRGRFDAPFDSYEFAVDVEDVGRGLPYRVTATVQWPMGRTYHSVTVETQIARRLLRPDEEEPPREPYERVDREARYAEEEEAALGGVSGG